MSSARSFLRTLRRLLHLPAWVEQLFDKSLVSEIALGNISARLDGLAGRLGDLQGSVRDLQGSVRDLQGSVGDLRGSLQELAAKLPERARMEALADDAARAGHTSDRLVALSEEYRVGAEAQMEGLVLVTRELAQVREDLDRLRQRLDELDRQPTP
jgi:methyl-accepting chemotaxis protein